MKTLLHSKVVAICGETSTPFAFFSVLTAVWPRPGPTGYKNIVPHEHVKQKWRPRTTKFKTFLIGDARFIRSSLLYLCILASASLTPLRAIKLLHSLGKVKRTKLLNQLFWPKLKRSSLINDNRSVLLWTAFSSPLKAALKTCLYCMTSSNVTGTVICLVGVTLLSHSSAVGKYNWPAILRCKREGENRVCFTFVIKHPTCLGFFLASEFVYVRMKKLHGSLSV